VLGAARQVGAKEPLLPLPPLPLRPPPVPRAQGLVSAPMMREMECLRVEAWSSCNDAITPAHQHAIGQPLGLLARWCGERLLTSCVPVPPQVLAQGHRPMLRCCMPPRKIPPPYAFTCAQRALARACGKERLASKTGLNWCGLGLPTTHKRPAWLTSDTLRYVLSRAPITHTPATKHMRMTHNAHAHHTGAQAWVGGTVVTVFRPQCSDHRAAPREE